MIVRKASRLRSQKRSSQQCNNWEKYRDIDQLYYARITVEFFLFFFSSCYNINTMNNTKHIGLATGQSSAHVYARRHPP